jgi:hypothetical protein
MRAARRSLKSLNITEQDLTVSLWVENCREKITIKDKKLFNYSILEDISVFHNITNYFTGDEVTAEAGF